MIPGTLFVLNTYKDQAAHDINLLTTRLRNQTLAGSWIHVQELAPSPDLLKQIEQWQWEKKWPKKWDEFKRMYLEELKEPQKQKLINGILKRLSSGLNVAIGCDTSNEKMSHNLIIAELIAGKSFPVNYAFENRTKPEKVFNESVTKGQVNMFEL